MNKDNELVIIGGGLAGSEAAWQAAQSGVRVKLYEMRPDVQTGAHVSGNLAELVCSNSLGSNNLDRANGLLLEELRRLDSLLIQCADSNALPAGTALAVDRERFSESVTTTLCNHSNIVIIRSECSLIPEQCCIIASGPLTSRALASQISSFTGKSNLFFYDAVSPIVVYDTINLDKTFRASRYREKDSGDYINCPMTREEYYSFVNELVNAERVNLKPFETQIEKGVTAGRGSYFEGCLPIEILAERGIDAIAYGPLRPTGLIDPHTNKRPYAVVQLRKDNLAGTLYNMVGFQTNLTYKEQDRVFRLIPGLENAEFVRYGQMHRNTYIFSPEILLPTLQTRKRPNLFFAGQIIGVEGYAGNIATGLLAGINAARLIKGESPLTLPLETMVGRLIHYVTHAEEKIFQPMKANYGLFLDQNDIQIRKNKKLRNLSIAETSIKLIEKWKSENIIRPKDFA